MKILLNISKPKLKVPSDIKYGLESWSWELACVYIDVLDYICINTNLTSIRKKALMGFHTNSAELFNQKICKNVEQGYGLVDAAQVQSSIKTEEGF